MSSFPDHYTIQRMSVLIVGIILVLGIVAMLANYHPAQTGPIVTQNPPPTITTPPLNVTPPTLNVTSFTAAYSFINAVESLNATNIYTFNSTKLFRFEYAYNPLALAITDILSLSANQVTPWTYSELYNVLDSNYTQFTSTRTVSMYYYPMNLSQNTIYLNFTFQTNPQFVNAYQQLSRYYPFPPSDNVTVNSPVYSIINMYSVTLTLSFSYSTNTYLAYSTTSQNGNQTIINRYYGMKVWGTVYLLANNNVIASNNFQISYEAVPPYKLPYPGAPIYQNTFQISGDINVPPGVPETVYLQYTITAYQYTKTTTSGNVTYINHYPTDPYFSYQSKTYNWYEYNVSIPISITVYNGSNPTTVIGNNQYNTRNIDTVLSYTVWSSEPISYISPNIITYDTIHFGNSAIERSWDAGDIEVTSQQYTEQNGNTINYYLSFNTVTNIKEPPPYIFHPIPGVDKSDVMEWSYFLNNASVSLGLWKASNYNINIYNFLLPQFITSVYAKNYTNNTIILASFVEPWNVSKATLNISNVYYNTKLIFLPVQIIHNTSYSIIYSALGSNYITPNVTILSYTWDNYTDGGYFPPLTENKLYNGTIPPASYSPFTNNIIMNYGYYWLYGLPYTEFSTQQLQKTYEYWYNPAWPGWFPIS